jgi:hypothetical protein
MTSEHLDAARHASAASWQTVASSAGAAPRIGQ